MSKNIHVHILQDVAAQIFTKQHLDMDNRKIEFDSTIREIYSPPKINQRQSSIQNVSQKGLPNIENNFKNHDWFPNKQFETYTNEYRTSNLNSPFKTNKIKGCCKLLVSDYILISVLIIQIWAKNIKT